MMHGDEANIFTSGLRCPVVLMRFHAVRTHEDCEAREGVHGLGSPSNQD
jgi:hypothetical protein